MHWGLTGAQNHRHIQVLYIGIPGDVHYIWLVCICPIVGSLSAP